MVPWQPAPREGEGNPYATGRPMDRSSLSGFLASRGVIGPDTAETMGNFGKRLQRAALAGSGEAGLAASQQLPLQERSLDQQDVSITLRARHLQQAAERAQRQFE